MEESNINEIITNSLKSKRDSNLTKENEIIKSFLQAIIENQILFEQANKVDLINKNGFKLDFNTIYKIFDKYVNAEPIINRQKDIDLTTDNMLYSKIYTNTGILLTLFNGDTYTMLELILLGILTHNTIIFAYENYMCGTNGFLINQIQTILEKNDYNKNMFQHSFNIELEKYFDNFKTIDKTILIGDNDFTTKYLKFCTTEVLISGYKNYDLYIEDDTHIEFINKILKETNDINIYVNNNLNIKLENAQYVDDLEEAITLINYNSSHYSSSIFTSDEEKASKFIKNIKSKFVMVNTSPTLEQSLDIKQKNLLKEKIILLPNVYKK